MSGGGLLIPREHGAWGMLGVSFFTGLILARGISWPVLAAAIAVVAAFLIREPLVVLGRQQWVWKVRRPETDAALRTLRWVAAALALSAGALLLARPRLPLLLLGAGAAALTAIAVYLTIRNRQRSVLLQIASAMGLNASALAAWLSVRPSLEEPVWWLWLALSVHSATGVLVVHARLDARIAAKAKQPQQQEAAGESWRRAWMAHCGHILLGLAAVSLGRAWIVAPLALSFAAHAWELRAMRRPGGLDKPLKRVGLQALSLSILYAVLLLAALLR